MKNYFAGFALVGFLLMPLGACTPTVTGNVGYNPGTGDISADIGFEFRPIPGKPGYFHRVPVGTPEVKTPESK